MHAAFLDRFAPAVRRSVRHLWAIDAVASGIRVATALAGVMLVSSLVGAIDLMIPLFLGVIAGALAETDDAWRNRARAVAVTLVLFAVSAVVVEALAPHPLPFLLVMVVSTFLLNMTGALGAGWATIAQATVILSVYAMLGTEQAGATASLWRTPLLLTLGAGWYGVLSIAWHALLPLQAVERGVAVLFEEIGAHLVCKSALFDPRRDFDIEAARVALARQNGRVVVASNRVRDLIRRRLDAGCGGAALDRWLGLFFVAQDIHERSSSTHHPYEAFAEAFFHSDVLFRCRMLLEHQGRACKALARALRGADAFVDVASAPALEDLAASLDHLRSLDRADQRELLAPLGDLHRNLEALEAQLARAADPALAPSDHDRGLFDDRPHSFAEIRRRVGAHLTPASPVFRHAVRLSLALGVGFGVKTLIHPTQGYWILLTTLFVCLPDYASTRRRLGQRVAGTVIGLVAGWASITLFPEPEVQRAIAVVAGVAFFGWRGERYMPATAAITLMVVCCFNQVVDGYAIILPRLEDTLIGSAISWAAVHFVLPDWQRRRLDEAVGRTLVAAAGYLRAVIRQYGSGKSDDLDYRLARRTAQEADAALATLSSNMLAEPGRHRRDVEAASRHLGLSHTLLSHLSALGAHREALPALAPATAGSEAALRIADDLDGIAADLVAGRAATAIEPADEAAAAWFEERAAGVDERDRRVFRLLALVRRHVAGIRAEVARL